jgi:Na+-translocating ferredoxin:NAD+ oxidoreductase RnfG subunit
VKNQNKSSQFLVKRLDRSLALVALLVIVTAWFIGSSSDEAKLINYLEEVVPDAHHFSPSPSGSYIAWGDQEEKQLQGYIAIGSAQGYGGMVKIAVVVNAQGILIHNKIIEHKETSSFLRRVLNRDFLSILKGKNYSDSFIIGQDIDGVTGATFTCRALAKGARKASRLIAVEELGFPDLPEPVIKVKFRYAEAFLILLFLVSYLGYYRKFKYKRVTRWLTLLIGMVVLGFIYNLPLTLIYVNKILLGYWPQWQLNLYFYLLVSGGLLFLLIKNVRPYCDWFCPFGAVQECLGLIGGAKIRFKGLVHKVLRWVPRILALGVIVLALLHRNPSIYNYEVFGAMFHLVGSIFLFSLLGFALLTSLFFKRSWCLYLCPLRPVTDYIRLMRNWVKELILNKKK